jgi:CheY-like chemotaxis protein
MDIPFDPAPVELLDMCLVVEDDSIIRLDIEETLRGFGFRCVLGASSLEAAAAIAETASLRFAVLDYEVGRGNTIEAASRLTARGVAAVFLTAHGSSIELPPDLRHLQVIAKPFSSEMLAKALRLTLTDVDLPCARGISCLSATG